VDLSFTAKVGTVTENMTEAIGGLMSGVTFKAEKAGIVHVAIGKMSFPDEDLLANLEAVLKVLVSLRYAPHLTTALTARGFFSEADLSAGPRALRSRTSGRAICLQR